jgi:hypothetical protein
MSYEAMAANWETSEAVDWNLVREELGTYLRKVIATFSVQNPEAMVYGIVVDRGQNWQLSVFLNTEEGYLSMPDRFRKQCIKHPPRTDAEILANLGRWYFDSWQFDFYQHQCPPEVNAVNNLHYETFERLNDLDPEGLLSDRFLQACAEATALLERSAEAQTLRRTEDFEIRFFDANCHEWDTGAVMEKAREKVAGG